MKKLMFVLLGLVAFPILMFAQEVTPVEIPDVPTSFLTLGGIATLVTFVMGFIKKWFKLAGTWAQVASWVVAIAVCYGGWLLKFGMLADVTSWYVPALYGIGVGLISNGIFKIEFVQAILRLFKLEPKKPIVK